jgi:parvulin-like peptidyl-prolyl isomerase
MDQNCSRHSLKLPFALLLSGLITGVVWAQAPKTATPTPAGSQTPSNPAGPTVQTPESADKVVLKVGGQLFTKADIDALIQGLPPQAQRSIAAQGKRPLGDQYAMTVMLSQQAQLHHLDQTPEFLHKLALQKLVLEAQSAGDEITQKAQATPEEVQQYYTAHAADYDEITVRQVVVRKKPAEAKTDPAHPAAPAGPGLSPEEAKTRAEAIRKAIVAGTDIKKVMDDFKAAGDVMIDAEPRKIHKGGMPPEMEKVAFALKDGEVSEVQELPQMLIFFQVVKHSRPELKEVTPEIEKNLHQQKVEAAMAELKKNAAVWMDEEYFAAPAKPAAGPTLGAPPAPRSAPTVAAPPKP